MLIIAGGILLAVIALAAARTLWRLALVVGALAVIGHLVGAEADSQDPALAPSR